MATSRADERVTPDAIRAKLREIDASLHSTTKAAAPAGMAVGAAGIIVVIIVAYLLGRRRGRRRQTFVEIRRI